MCSSESPVVDLEAEKNRLAKCHDLLNNMKYDTYGMMPFFPDEKNFNRHQKSNAKNDRYLPDAPSEVPIIMQVRFSVHMMVLGVSSSEGNVTPPHIFEKTIQVNTAVYLKVLKDVVNRGEAGSPTDVLMYSSWTVLPPT